MTQVAEAVETAPEPLAETGNETNKAESLPARKRRRKSRGWTRSMHWIRRIHLYLGLLMLPWVLLYGFTGMLFNHPAIMSDYEIVDIGEVERTNTSLAAMPDRVALAQQVVDKLGVLSVASEEGIAAADEGIDAAGEGTDATMEGTETAGEVYKATPVSYRLGDPDKILYSGRAFARMDTEDEERIILMDLMHGTGTLRTRSRSQSTVAPFASEEPVRIDEPVTDQLKQGFSEVMAGMGVEGGEMRIRRMPSLVFDMEDDAGRLWQVRYALQAGTVTGRLLDVPGEISPRRFLTRMHLGHTYPASINARWFWAIAVDVMFVSMIFWGISGVLMWFQIKPTRSIGTIMMILSALAAIVLGSGMHSALVSGL